MAIEAFYPESERSGHLRKHGLEEKMVKNDIVSHADVQNYANYIVGKLKNSKNASEDAQKSFVIDALNSDRIFENFFYSSVINNFQIADKLDKKALQGAFLRIRKALVEELKGKIDGKMYLVIDDIVKKMEKSEHPTLRQSSTDPLVEEIEIPEVLNPRKRNVISVVENIDNGVQGVYKDQQWKVPVSHEGAFSLYTQMVPHPSIAKIKEYDPENNRFIYEKLNLKSTLSVYDKKINGSLDFYKNTPEFVAAIKVLNDCVEGALHLENNHLVLQDIKLSNIGIEKSGEELKGVLFDLEGLVEEGKFRRGRLRADGYLPPEAEPSSSDSSGLSKIGPKEMSFQFGVCLQKIIDSFVSEDVYEMLKLNKSLTSRRKLAAIEDVKKLALKMQERDPQDRVDLRTANIELSSIIENFKKILK